MNAPIELKERRRRIMQNSGEIQVDATRRGWPTSRSLDTQANERRLELKGEPMGFLSWLFRGSASSRRSIRVDGYIAGRGQFSTEVYGESEYQADLEAIAGGRTFDGHRLLVDAVLIVDHEYQEAVAVFIGGRRCGCLYAADASNVYKRLKKLGALDKNIGCKAMIVGGWDRGPGDHGHFGVKLDIPSKWAL